MSPALFGEWVVPASVLVVEDDAPLRETLAATLGTLGGEVHTAATLSEAIREVTKRPVELVLLDIGLPDGDGTELLKRLRAATDVPVIVLSGRTDEEDKIAILDAGADDFLIKPCSAAELLARVRGLMRRVASAAVGKRWARVELDGVVIDLVAQQVVRHGVPQRLTPTEWGLLRALVLHAGRPLSTRQLWDLVWDREFGDFATHVRVHITHLRRKVEPDPSMPRLIVTEPGVGYRFVEPA